MDPRAKVRQKEKELFNLEIENSGGIWVRWDWYATVGKIQKEEIKELHERCWKALEMRGMRKRKSHETLITQSKGLSYKDKTTS